MRSKKFHPHIEFKSPEEIKRFQEIQLHKELIYLTQYSKFYRKLFREHQIDIRKIKNLEDLRQVPVTTKNELQKFNKDFICVPKSDIIDYNTTSGTSGDPVTFVCSQNDLERLAYNEAISFALTGADKKSIFQLMTTIDRRFMAGMAYFLGVKKLGAGIIRVGSGMPDLQWESILRFKPDYIIAVPSFILKLIEFARENNIDTASTSVKKAICIGEPLRNEDFSYNALSKRILSGWNIELFSTYASTEMGASFNECSHKNGGHQHPELIITEFLDENNNAVHEGQPGELTITTIGVEAMPLLRFKTGDICCHYIQPCGCGRNTIRLGPVIGRKQQMIKYKGTTLYPSALNNLLDNYPEITNYIVEVTTNEIGIDHLKIQIGCIAYSPELECNLKDHFRAKLRVVPEIEFLNPAEINKKQFPEGSRKAIKFIDNRKN